MLGEKADDDICGVCDDDGDKDDYGCYGMVMKMIVGWINDTKY